MKTVVREKTDIARCILPRDKSEFECWHSGNEITMGIRRVMFQNLGEHTENGEKARKVLLEDLRRSKSPNMDTYCQFCTGKNLIALIKEAREKSGLAIIENENLHLLEIQDPRLTIPSLTRESIETLL